MDGNIAPLKEICDLAEEYKALVLIDECHATGFLGKVRSTCLLAGLAMNLFISLLLQLWGSLVASAKVGVDGPSLQTSLVHSALDWPGYR